MEKDRIKKVWLGELARDLISFGSIPFLVLTTARVSFISLYYTMQFIISSLLFFILRAVFKGDFRAGLGIILLGFTSIYYGSLVFFIFAMLVYAGIIFSLFYLKHGTQTIFKGVLLGAVSAVVGYFIVRLMFF